MSSPAAEKIISEGTEVAGITKNRKLHQGKEEGNLSFFVGTKIRGDQYSREGRA